MENLDQNNHEFGVNGGTGKRDHLFKRHWQWVVVGIVVILLIIGGIVWWAMSDSGMKVDTGEMPEDEKLVEEYKGKIYLVKENGEEEDEFKIKVMMDTMGWNIAVGEAWVAYNPEVVEVKEINGESSVLSMSARAEILENEVELVRGEPADSNYKDSDDGFTGSAGLLSEVIFKTIGEGNDGIQLVDKKSKLILDDGKGTIMETELINL